MLDSSLRLTEEQSYSNYQHCQPGGIIELLDTEDRHTATCSGIASSILKSKCGDDTSPVIARYPSQPRDDNGRLINCWLVYPGCDFEVYIENEVASIFRRGDILVICDDFRSVLGRSIGIEHFEAARYLCREDFNRELHNNLKLAFEHVTNNADIVGTSRHFVDLFASMIEELEEISDTAEMSAEAKARINDLKVKAFGILLSEDLRR